MNKNRKSPMQRPPSLQLRIHPKAFEIANRLGINSLIENLRDSFGVASQVATRLEDCRQFRFLSARDIDDLSSWDQSRGNEHFWRQLNELLIVSSASAARAIMSLIDALSSALGTTNELMFALSARAVVEHCATLESIRSELEGRKQFLVLEVWPKLKPYAEIVPGNEDKSLRDKLIKFVAGRRIDLRDQPIPSASDGHEAWRTFRDSLEKFPEELKAINALTLVDKLSKHPGQKHFRVVYEMLCEFCHPNSASRLLDFDISSPTASRLSLRREVSPFPSPGFRRVVKLGVAVLPDCVRLLTEAISLLDAAIEPMPPQMGSRSPFPGCIRVVDSHGRLGWIRYGEVFFQLPEKKAVLTESQKDRIRRIHSIVGYVDHMPLERSMELFSCEGAYVDDEISHFEHMASVFTHFCETGLYRSQESQEELYAIIFRSADFDTLDQLLSANPQFSRVANVKEVFKKTRGAFKTKRE